MPAVYNSNQPFCEMLCYKMENDLYELKLWMQDGQEMLLL